LKINLAIRQSLKKMMEKGGVKRGKHKRGSLKEFRGGYSSFIRRYGRMW